MCAVYNGRPRERDMIIKYARCAYITYRLSRAIDRAPFAVRDYFEGAGFSGVWFVYCNEVALCANNLDVMCVLLKLDG